METNYLDFGAVLLWLMAGGSTFAVNWIIANFLEKKEWWGALDSSVKMIVPLVIALALGIGAGELLKNVAVIEAIQPYWTTFVMVASSYFGSQSGHIATKNAQK